MDSDHPLAPRAKSAKSRRHRFPSRHGNSFDGIPLEKVSTPRPSNPPPPSCSVSTWRCETPRRQFAKTFRHRAERCLKGIIARGHYIYPVRPAMRIVTDIFAWCAAIVPKWKPISISGYHIREAAPLPSKEVALHSRRWHRLPSSRALDAGPPRR